MERDRPAFVCHECGTLHGVRRLPSGVTALCRTCGAPLYRQRKDTAVRALALTVAALILFAVAHTFPFLTFSMEGNATTATILGSAFALYRDGVWPLAAVVFAMASLFPLLKLLLNLYTLVPLATGWRAPGTHRMFAAAARLRTWAMTEVYLLGVIVAYVKLSDLATLTVGPALWAFGLLIVCMAAADNVLDPRAVWWRIAPQNRLGALLAKGQPLAACHVCAQVVPLPAGAHGAACPRCGAALHHRKPDALARTSALCLAAAILYVPANILPVMTVTSFGRGESDTIISGVVTLIEAGMWPVAALVFFASITVPVLKLVGLFYLLLSVQFGWHARPRERTRLYRVIEQIGRWSMIDIFMIAILAVLVDLGEIARIEPGAGALAFAGVVILTMLASASFEPRLIWDNERKRHGKLRPAVQADG
jgi:paraquat-inducible protein A